MLPESVAAKSFQPVAGRHPQIIEAGSRVDRKQLGTSPALDRSGQPTNGIAREDGCSALAGKALDHGLT